MSAEETGDSDHYSPEWVEPFLMVIPTSLVLLMPLRNPYAPGCRTH